MLKKRRKDEKITQLKLASKLDVRDTYISELEKHPEKCNPTLNIILGLSTHLKINPHNILDYFINSRENNKKR